MKWHTVGLGLRLFMQPDDVKDRGIELSASVETQQDATELALAYAAFEIGRYLAPLVAEGREVQVFDAKVETWEE